MSINPGKIKKFYEECQVLAQVKRQAVNNLTTMVNVPEAFNSDDFDTKCKCPSLRRLWKSLHRLLKEFQMQLENYSDLTEKDNHIDSISGIILRIR